VRRLRKMTHLGIVMHSLRPWTTCINGRIYNISVIMNKRYVLNLLCHSQHHTCLMEFTCRVILFIEVLWPLRVWDISVICPIVVLKLDVTVFISVYFQTLWLNWLNFFQSQKFGPWLKKTSFVVVYNLWHSNSSDFWVWRG